MSRVSILFASVFVWLFFTTAAAGAPPTVFVSVLPQKFFVQQIAGDKVLVEVMVQAGASPATYEPKASQMRKLAGAAVYFSIGVPFEQSWLERIRGVNREMLIVPTDRGITKLAMESHNHHEADKEGEDHDHHVHSSLDPHIWLSPSLVKRQTEIMADTFTDLYPDRAEEFKENLDKFHAEIDAVDQQLRKSLHSLRGRNFMVFHPSWGYFANEYGLNQVAVEIEGKSPKPGQLRELVELAQQHEIDAIFVQPQFSQKSAAIIAQEIGGKVVILDPLAENWPQNMKKVAEQLRDAMK